MSHGHFVIAKPKKQRGKLVERFCARSVVEAHDRARYWRDGGYSARIYERQVSAENVPILVWVVIARERLRAPAPRATRSIHTGYNDDALDGDDFDGSQP